MTTLANIWVQLHGDWTRLRAEAPVEGAAAGRAFGAAFEREVRSVNPTVRPTLDPTLFRRQWNMFQTAYLHDRTINITPVLTGSLRFNARDRTLQVSPRLDLTVFRAQWRVFAAAYLHPIHRINVHPHISTTSLNIMINALSDAGDRGGSRAAGKFFDSFTNRATLMLGAIAGALPLITPLLQVLGDVVQAAAAVGAAIPAGLAAAGVGVAALVLSFRGLGDAIAGAFSGDPTKKQREAFDGLSRSAKTFVGQLLESRTALRGFRQEVQESFFRPFVEGFDLIIKSRLFPLLRSELALTASAAGGAGASIAATIAEAVGSGQVEAILRGSRETLASILAVLPKAVRLFLDLAEAAQPFVHLITDQLAQAFGDFADRVNAMAGDGRLAKFFENGATQLFALTRLLINVKDIFGTVFDAFNGGADSALGALSALTGQVAAFLKSAQGQQILALFAEKLQLIGDIIKTVLGPVLPVLIKLAQIVSGALNGAIQQLLPVVERVLDAVAAGLLPILDAVAPVVNRVVTVLADFLVLALREVAVHIEQMMPTLVELAKRLGPQLIPLVEALGDALIALIPLIPTFTRFLADVLPIVIDLLPLLEGFIATSVRLTQVFATVIQWTVQLITWMGNLNQAITKLPIAIGETAEFFRRIWDAVLSWFTGTIVPSFRKALDDIRSFFAGMVNFVRDRWDVLVALLRTGYETVKRVVFDPLMELVNNRIPHAFRTGVDLVEFWWRRLQDVAKVPVRFVIETVVNKGIIGTFNTIAGFLPGVPKLNTVGLPAGFADGGFFDGLLPGRPSNVDNMLARGPGGKPVALATGEFVVNAEATRRNLPTLLAINEGRDGFAVGGLIGAILNPAGFVRDRVDSLIARIPGGALGQIGAGMSRRLVEGLIEFVRDKIKSLFSAVGGSVSANGLQAGISAVLAELRAVFGNVPLISGLRPGDRTLSGSISYHSSGRAIDIPPVLAWAQYLNARWGPLLRELITPWQFLNIHNGRQHNYSAAVWNQHNFAGGNAHIHAALAKGGLMARLFDAGGLWPSGTVGLNMSGGTEVVTPAPTMDEVIEVLLRILGALQRLAPDIGRELTGATAQAIRVGRARV